MKKFTKLLLLFILPSLLVSQTTVVDIIVNSEDHNTLEAAVVAADLATTLSGDGPFTVFAPTDDAFAALPEGTVETLLDDPMGALTDILLNHVVAGSIASTDLVDGTTAVTLNNGKTIAIAINDDGVFINDVQVTMADVMTDNGIVHIIDAVLLPNSTIADVVIDSEVHTTLETALGAAGLVETLNGAGPFTVFAPTDDAFAELPEGTVETLLEDPTGALTDILLNHVVAGSIASSDLVDGLTAVTLNNGKTLSITINDDGVFINDAQVTIAQVMTDNGIVHIIDAVLLPNNTVADAVIDSEVHTTLEAALDAAGLVETLNGAGPFTVFAPTDDAFAALPEGTVETLLEDPMGELTQILLYHVLNGTVLSTDLSDGLTVATINAKDITVTINDEGAFINDAKVTITDLETDNGVVHVIDAVLLPPRITVVDIVVNSEVHNTLEAAVLAADLATTLSGDGPFTLFAPTDDAFAALPEGTVETLLDDPMGALTDILLNHVISGEVASTDLSDGTTAVTLNNGKTVAITINDDGVFINDVQVTMADVMTDNGIVHIVDAVLLPNNTVADIVIDSEVHTTLEAALGAADLVKTLNGAGPFTVFAPTDEAFAALPEGTVETLLEDPMGELTQILLYHVLNGTVLSTDLADGLTVATINGKDITVTINDEGAFINDAKVTITDLETDNGVVHVIDAVLLPPRITVVDIVVNSEVHNTLEAAVIAADLATTLSGDGPFTLFAPTDDAFAGLPEGTVETLLDDPMGALTDILLNHVISGEVASTNLSDGTTAVTLNNGKTVAITINDDGVFINDAQVTMADVMTDNGIVHIIDAVLLPNNTVADVVIDSEAHTTLEAALDAAGLVETLNGAGPFTVFAPTDEAFAALPEGTVATLLEDPTGQLTNILLNHVLGKDLKAGDLADGQIETTLNGTDITVTITDQGVMIGEAMVTMADIATDNGVVHVIDAVLLPVSSSTENVGNNFASFNIFPNPSADYIQLEANKLEFQNAKLKIYDAQGQLVRIFSDSQLSESMNITDIRNGIYLVEYINGEMRYIKKLVIQK